MEPRSKLTFASSDQFSPWWSPDGSRLAYSGYPTADAEISVMELSTETIAPFPGSRGLCCPTWSRNGRYMLALATSPPRIMVLDFAGKAWSELWRGPFNYYDTSRDEAYIYFDSRWQNNPAIYRLRIRDRKLETCQLEQFSQNPRSHGVLVRRRSGQLTLITAQPLARSRSIGWISNCTDRAMQIHSLGVPRQIVRPTAKLGANCL